MDPLLDFSGKVALITGAAQGFGRLLAEELAQRGAHLVLGDINLDQLNEVKREITAKGAKVVALHCDVAQAEHCNDMATAALENFGQLDIAVNNAGVAHSFMPMHEIDEALMDKQFAVNVKGVQFGMRSQLGQMLKQQNGAILNVSSMAGMGGAPYLGAYSAAKHAVIGLTKSAAVEYARYNIRVNAICPFFTLTNMVTDMSDADEQLTLAKRCPMRRLAEPKEVVAMMLMMLSPGNSYMTGQCISVDGGVSAM